MANTIKSSTQDHLDIEAIKDNLIILKTGGAVAVLKTTAVNFDLLSEPEQDAMIAAFGNLLNSLSFHVQIILRSKKMDISEYLKTIKLAENEQQDTLLKKYTAAYREFIDELVTKNEVLDKEFYVAIPYAGAILPQGGDPFGFIKQLFGSGTKRVRVNVDDVSKKAGVQLGPKAEHLIKQFSRVGIQARQISTEELVELIFDVYNPVVSISEKTKLSIEDYKAPIVEPALAEGTEG